MPIISRWYSGSFSWLYTMSSSSAKVMRLHFCPAADSLAGDLQSNKIFVIFCNDHGIWLPCHGTGLQESPDAPAMFVQLQLKVQALCMHHMPFSFGACLKSSLFCRATPN